ncbi:MAG: polyamine aminopropyltransferase [Syntrophobacterales bacterium]|nr:polyamine aminopropyltransferase [Syntrophobacterales bacterium]
MSRHEGLNNDYIWFREPSLNGVSISYLCDRIIYHGVSKYQRIDIVETRLHGKMLFLDGVAQSAERDEFIYHELLVHPAMFAHPKPEKVLIIGGAEGATLREVLKHRTVKRAVLVDIDGELVEICKKYLPSWHQGSFDDPRVEVVIDDGRAYVENSQEKFDVIIVDLSDPFEDSPAVFLFTKEFYLLLKEHLTPYGCTSIQGEGVSPQEHTLHVRMVNTLREVFPVVMPHIYSMHSFHRPDSHIFTTLQKDWTPQETAKRFEMSGMKLKYLNKEMLEKLFVLPSYLKESYERDKQIITDANPSFEGVYHRVPSIAS